MLIGFLLILSGCGSSLVEIDKVDRIKCGDISKDDCVLVPRGFVLERGHLEVENIRLRIERDMCRGQK
jgi:hypothetical protein